MNESRRRAAANWGLIAAAAAGAVGVSGFALSDGRVNDLTITDSAGPTGFVEAPWITTTTTAQPGLKSVPVKRTAAGAGSHTGSHGS